METRIPWPTPAQEMVSLVMFCWTGEVVGAWAGRRVMKVQIATMLKGRVMNGREKVLRRLLRALVMNMLKQEYEAEEINFLRES